MSVLLTLNKVSNGPIGPGFAALTVTLDAMFTALLDGDYRFISPATCFKETTPVTPIEAGDIIGLCQGQRTVGTGYDATQASTPDKPEIVIQDGEFFMHCDDLGDRLRNLAVNTYTLPYCIGVSGYTLAITSATNENWVNYVNVGSAQVKRSTAYRARGDSGINIEDPTPLVALQRVTVLYVAKGALSELWVDGVLKNTNAAGNSDTGSIFDWGARADGLNVAKETLFDKEFALEGAVTAQNITDMNNWLAAEVSV